MYIEMVYKYKVGILLYMLAIVTKINWKTKFLRDVIV